MIERGRESMHIENISKLGKWKEWVEQSRLLSEQWMNDVKKNGFKKSPTATIFATIPSGVEHVCSELELDQLKDGDMIVEVGTGPGPIIQGVLREVRAEITYVAVELNPKFANHLRETVQDSRLVVVNENAANLTDIVKRYGPEASRVISSMPFSTNKKLTQSILGQIRDILTPGGSFVMANFTPESVMSVIRFFGRKNCKTGWAINGPFLLTVVAKNPQKKSPKTSSAGH
jgi:phospholipid N-methyltransferase